MMPDVIIIGGGLMGFSTALHLAKRGVKALILEKDTPGRHASGVNAGGLRRLNRHPAEIPLSVAAAKLWHKIEDLVDSDCDARFPGQIRIAENDDDMQKVIERVAMVRSLGFEHEEVIQQEELYQHLPALKKGCVGGVMCRDDGFARPFHALDAFKKKTLSLGGQYVDSCSVRHIKQLHGVWQISTDSKQFTAPILVNCAGAWANEIANMSGEPVPLEARAPMMMVTERLPMFIKPVVGAVSRKLSFKQMQNGTLLIGGAHLAKLDLVKQTTHMNWQKLAVSARTVLALFPQLGNARIVRTWAGIEGFMPDNLPIISKSITYDNLFHAFGFSAHGFQLSPLIGEIMADLVLNNSTKHPISPFRINRFY